MNRELARCMVRSLSVDVNGPREESLLRLRSFSRRDWERTLSWLDDSGLALYLLNLLNLLKSTGRAKGAGVLPEPIHARLRQNLASNRQRLTEMKREFDGLNRRFEAAGVDFAVLKGLALAPEFCSDPALRLQYDYDYLVRPESESAARQALETAGYAQTIQSPGHEPEGATLFVSEPQKPYPSDHDFYSAALPRRVELHLGLWEPADEGVRLDLPGDFLDRKRTAEFEGVRFPVLADDDALLFQVLHAFHHMLCHWCRPSCFLEIVYFLTRQNPNHSFWNQFGARVENRRYLTEIVQLVFSVATTLFGGRIPDEIARWPALSTVQSPVLSLWVREYGERWAMAAFPGSKLSLFMHGEFVGDRGLWKRVRLNLLLPLHRPAKVIQTPGGNGGARLNARWKQRRFVLGRVRFHLRGLLAYVWHFPHWKKVLRRAGGRRRRRPPGHSE